MSVEDNTVRINVNASRILSVNDFDELMYHIATPVTAMM
jgi:hypothetical protein